MTQQAPADMIRTSSIRAALRDLRTVCREAEWQEGYDTGRHLPGEIVLDDGSWLECYVAESSDGWHTPWRVRGSPRVARRAEGDVPSVNDWNPRYVAYAAAHGRGPDAMLAHDREAWPGGCMVGFMCWISDGLAAWQKARGLSRFESPVGDEAHDDFTAFLRERATLERSCEQTCRF